MVNAPTPRTSGNLHIAAPPAPALVFVNCALAPAASLPGGHLSGASAASGRGRIIGKQGLRRSRAYSVPAVRNPQQWHTSTRSDAVYWTATCTAVNRLPVHLRHPRIAAPAMALRHACGPASHAAGARPRRARAAEIPAAAAPIHINPTTGCRRTLSLPLRERWKRKGHSA
jgi:hypothetical protein